MKSKPGYEAERFENLLAVPSYHFEPVFAAEVRAAWTSFRPTVVALELWCALEPELDWALSCWPGPVCSVWGKVAMPWVPGDSMLEAGRLARRDGVPVELVDVPVAGSVRHGSAQLPSPEYAARLGPVFLEAVDALGDAAGWVAPGDLAREASMARRLTTLMQRHERVLWVGGMAHWSRIRRRLADRDFAGPKVPRRRPGRFARRRLVPADVWYASQRLPYCVAGYAAQPDEYDEMAVLRTLAIQALDTPATRGRGPVLTFAGHTPGLEDEVGIESGTTADVMRLLLYARNLTATQGLGERPDLFELLTAASAVIGNRYAARLYLLAMEERSSEVALRYPTLDYDPGDTRRGPSFVVSGFGPPPAGLPGVEAVERRRTEVIYRGLPAAGKDEKRVWCEHPAEEAGYMAFVRYVLRRASSTDGSESKSGPFVSGLRDGVDVRATLRHWNDGTVHVREEQSLRLHVTNAIIDYSSLDEQSPMLCGELPDSGWTDPSFTRVGSFSRHLRSDLVETHPEVRVMHREWSFVTLDCPTSIQDAESLYDYVIKKLVDLPKSRDHLYEWLELTFRFCRGKTVAYYSRYLPSERIHRVAAKHGVRVVHCPLERIPKPLLERNSRFLFMYLTRSQWEAAKVRDAELRHAWLP